METNNPRYYKFGEFILDSRRRILSKNDGEIPISAKNFDLLFQLVKNEGRILTHDELLDAVWEGTFVEQSNLKKGISALRQILGETPDSSLYIKTIPRKGYSFIAPVSRYEDAGQTFTVSATEIIVEDEIIEDDEISSPKQILPPNSEKSNWQKYSKTILIFSIILILGVLAVGFRSLFAKKGKRFSVENVKISKITNDGNCADASISADGNFILCGSNSPDGSTLITRQVSTKSQIQLLPPQKDIAFWAYKITPDGNSVYYMLHDNSDSSRDGLFQIPFLGGTSRKINNGALHITFSPDGKRMGFVRIFPTSNQIVTANLDGSDEKIITEYSEGHRIWGLNWSPDGKTILCSVRLQANEKYTGFVDEISLSDGSKNRIFENERMIVSASWMPDKTSMILGLREMNNEVRQIWQYFPDSKELIRVTNDNNTYRFPVLNQSGNIISVSQESMLGGIYQSEIGNTDIKLLTNDNGLFNDISKTKDGRLVYTSYDEGNEAVWIMNTDGSGKQQLTDGKDGIYLSPRASNDGKSLIFISTRSGTKEFWQINFDGSGLTQLTKSIDEIPIGAKGLSDGKSLIGFTINKNTPTIWKRNEAGEKNILAEKVGFGWDVSPNEKLLIFDRINENSKQPEIVVQSLENNQILHTFNSKTEYFLNWVNDNSFVYQTKNGDKYQIYLQELGKNPPKLVHEYNWQPNIRIPSLIFLDDGKKYVMVKTKYLVDAVTIKINDSK